MRHRLSTHKVVFRVVSGVLAVVLIKATNMGVLLALGIALCLACAWEAVYEYYMEEK